MIVRFAPFNAILAANPLQSMGTGFRGSHARFGWEELLTGLALLACVVVGLVLLTRLLTREERSQRTNNPRALFRSLCRAHRLQRREAQLLGRVARAQQLDQPARLFVEPQRFEELRDDPQFRRDRALLDGVVTRLFTGLHETWPRKEAHSEKVS